MPDLRALLTDAAEIPDGGDIDAVALLARARRRRRRRRLAASGPLVLVALLGAGMALRAVASGPAEVGFAERSAPSTAGSSPDATAPEGTTVLDVPAEGDVIAALLDDGTEVFVVHRAGQVRVLDAHRRGVASFPPSLMGWCPTSQAFEDDLFGSRFDALGRYTGGPAPSGMVPYATEVRDGRVHVGQAQPAPSRSERGDPAAGPTCFAPGDAGGVPLGHHRPPSPALSVPEALRAAVGATVVVDARVEIRPAGSRVCAIPSEGALVRGEPNPVEQRCPPDAPQISGVDLGETPPEALYVYEGRHLLTRTVSGFTDLVIAAGTAEAVGGVAPAGSEVTDADRALIDAFRRFAGSASPDAFAALPLAADGVRLGLAERLEPARSPGELAEPAAWQLQEEAFRGYVGPFSALELLAGTDALEVSVGPHPHCVSPPVPAPEEVAHLRRVSAQPQEVGSCLEWFTVDWFVGPDGAVQAVTLDLYEP